MGTRTNSRQSRRRTKRGLASFVSFVLLFAFALGQSSLSALADDAGTDPVAAEEVLSDGSTDEGTLPVEEAPAEEAPAEEAPAEEAPAEEAPAAEAEGDASTDGDVGSAESGEARTGQINVARANRTTAIAAPAAPPGGSLDGGDIDLDFIAAGPFTYNHATGLGTYPQFGYNDRNISKSNGVVESLESGDFECDDLVTFFTQITVDSGAASGGTIELDYTYGAETTGQPGLGFTDIISVAVNTPDDGNKNLDGDEVATLIDEGLDTSGYDQVTGTVQIEGLDPGDVVIVRSIVLLECLQGDSPTGNILSAIESGRVTDPENDTIQVGQQTVPMKTTGFVAEPAIDIEKTCPAEAAFGDDITYDITITNNGNEDLENIVVTDTVNGNAPDDISDLFADTLAAGASESAQYVYSPDANDPDPLPNTVTVTADGAFSSTEVTDTDTCDTDITHEPGIVVTKDCPESAPFGEDIEYTITVENTGNEPLVGVTVNDTLLGDITGDFDFDFSADFPVGEVATAVVSYTPQAGDPDPLVNTVTASGTGADSGVEASDEASCDTDILNPSIGVTKSCTALAHVGDTVTYTITVTNTGDEDLDNVTVVDSILGDLSGLFADELAAGASESHDVDYVVLESDPDPLVNEVTAKGSGVGSRVAVEALANCVTDLIHPGIEIVKTVDEDTVPIGTTVTYTYVVTNTGDTTLFDISVDDDILGHIGDIAVLEPGESATLTKDFVVGDVPVTNVGTATGEDILGRSVSSNDDAIVTPIAGEGPPPTPFTGSDAGRLGIISMVLFGIGVTVVATTRRRRPEREAA
jgi:uncharacterized repeat protein (TIGR01451 family)